RKNAPGAFEHEKSAFLNVLIKSRHHVVQTDGLSPFLRGLMRSQRFGESVHGFDKIFRRKTRELLHFFRIVSYDGAGLNGLPVSEFSRAAKHRQKARANSG